MWFFLGIIYDLNFPSQWKKFSFRHFYLTSLGRAHRVHSKGTSPNGSPPYLVVKMVNWEFSEKVKSAFIHENQNGRSQVFVSQMYSKSLTLHRNKALKHRHEMKEEDPSIHGYIRYPATLMIKDLVKKSIRLRRNFNFILCWQSFLWFHFSMFLYHMPVCELLGTYSRDDNIKH